jgi:hypothetical protein
MTNENINAFVLEYTKEIDLINCINFSIDNNFSKPRNYTEYGCKIDFLTKEKSTVTDKDSLEEWYILHHNKFVKSKMVKGDSIGYTSPPPYNFITEDNIKINSIKDNCSEVEVETEIGTYILDIIEGNDNDYKMLISSVSIKSLWSDNLIPIIK